MAFVQHEVVPSGTCCLKKGKVNILGWGVGSAGNTIILQAWGPGVRYLLSGPSVGDIGNGGLVPGAHRLASLACSVRSNERPCLKIKADLLLTIPDVDLWSHTSPLSLPTHTSAGGGRGELGKGVFQADNLV